MSREDARKILNLLDLLAVEVGATHAGVNRLEARFDGLEGRLDDLTAETRSGFDRVDRRLGNLETRLEDVETFVRPLR
jgi:hypothetical protein